MTHQLNTPASIQALRALLDASMVALTDVTTATPESIAIWNNAGEAIDAFASRTEQAAPSVASGVEKDEAAITGYRWRRIERDGKWSAWNYSPDDPRKWSSWESDWTPQWGVNALCIAMVDAAPGAAIAAREQEVDEATALKGGRWVSADDIEHMTGELLSLATGDPYTPTKMVDAFHTLRAALASRQEAPAASEDEIHMAWRGALKACGVSDADRDAITEVVRSMLPTPAHSPATVASETYQSRVDEWLIKCFGETIARDPDERNHRFLEEALELVQAAGCTRSEAIQLVDYVFRRPVGELGQEVGGVMTTLAALCLARRVDMRHESERELARINDPEMVEKIRAKQAAKPKHSPLPQ